MILCDGMDSVHNREPERRRVGGDWGWLGHSSLFRKYHRNYLRYRFRIDTTRKVNPSSTNIINKLCCHFIRYDRIR